MTSRIPVGLSNSLSGRTHNKSGISDTFEINDTLTNYANKISNEFSNYFTNIGKDYADKIPASRYALDHCLQHKNQNNMLWLQLILMKLKK